MTTDEKLAAILAAVQTDPGNRGLARDPHDNLFTATAGDFAAACRSIADHSKPALEIVTGFFIPTATPPAMETDGPLGAVFLVRGLAGLGIESAIISDAGCRSAVLAGLDRAGQRKHFIQAYGSRNAPPDGLSPVTLGSNTGPVTWVTHCVAVERVGPAADGRCYTMRGRDVSDHTTPTERLFTGPEWRFGGPKHPITGRREWEVRTIGIGDGGNEIGMGKIPHETTIKNIPNGDLIHCRVPTDHLIVAGVSNWGAYALAAGVYVLRGVKPLADLFDPDREREILEVMVREGPLVDGVTGQQTATVDGLTWDEYAKPLIRIREILEW
jgi:hypothetical protein